MSLAKVERKLFIVDNFNNLNGILITEENFFFLYENFSESSFKKPVCLNIKNYFLVQKFFEDYKDSVVCYVVNTPPTSFLSLFQQVEVLKTYSKNLDFCCDTLNKKLKNLQEVL